MSNDQGHDTGHRGDPDAERCDCTTCVSRRRRRRDRVQLSRGNKHLSAVVRALERADHLIRAWLRQHPDGCRCRSCRYVGARDLPRLRDDLRAARWNAEMSASVIGNEVVPDDRELSALGERIDARDRAAGRAGADEPAAVVVVRPAG